MEDRCVALAGAGTQVRVRAMTALPPDDVLVARMRNRDEAAFALLLDAWSPGMLRLARDFVSTNDSTTSAEHPRSALCASAAST